MVERLQITYKHKNATKTMRAAFTATPQGFEQHPYTGVVINKKDIIMIKKWKLQD